MKLHHPNAFLSDRDLFKLNLADRSVQYFVWYPEHWVSSSVLLLPVYLSPLNNAFLTPLSILMGLSQPSSQQQPHHRSLIFFPIVFYSNCSLHHPAPAARPCSTSPPPATDLLWNTPHCRFYNQLANLKRNFFIDFTKNSLATGEEPLLISQIKVNIFCYFSNHNYSLSDAGFFSAS